MNAKHLIKIFLTIALLVMVTGCGSTPTPVPPAEVASDDSAPAEAPVEAQAQAPAAGFTPSSKCIVPDVVGLDIAVAESNLAGPGLQPVKDFRHDESVAENAIISQEPAAGTTLEPCEGDVVVVVSLGAVPVPTNTPRPTDIPASPTPIPTETPLPPTPTIDPNPPSGQWAVKAFNTNDASIIIVNGKLVGASTVKQQQDTDWISITDLLVLGENLVTFANWNGAASGSWGFSIRRDETVVWGAESDTGPHFSLNYAQTVAIKSAGTVEPVPLDTSAYPTLSDAWSVRIRDTADVGVVLVNGYVVAGTGNWGARDTEWVDITGLLRADQDNTISMHVWNFDADYSWRISIRKEETTVWESERSSGGSPGVVFSDSVTITADGELQQ